MAETEGTQIILVNSRNEVLMYLRDDKPEIKYPNMWCLLGGMLDPGETPAECIIREIEEEIGVRLNPETVTHLCTRHLEFGIEHTFTSLVDFEIDDVTLNEGQALRWFTRSDATKTNLGYGDNAILETFFGSLHASPGT